MNISEKKKLISERDNAVARADAYAGLIGVNITLKPEHRVPQTLKTQFEIDLIDPTDVLYRNVKTSPAGWVVCGEFNAKNTLGGRAGWVEFLAIDHSSGQGKWTIYHNVGTALSWNIVKSFGKSCQ